MTTTPARLDEDAPAFLDHVGGEEGLQRLIASWYPTVLVDPLLHPLFGSGHADHVDLHACQEVPRWSW